MVKIRLTRIGKKHQPHYRMIVIQARTKREGMALDQIGYYNPRTKPSTIEIDAEKAKAWIAKGAQPTDTVRYLLIKQNIIPAPASKKAFSSKPGRKATERAAAAAEAQEKASE